MPTVRTEGASGLSAITKVVISYENKCIPANLNLKKLKSTIAEMSPPLLPVNDNLPYSPGIYRFLENLQIILLPKKIR
jgi:acyl transferase domain-containing protein